MNLGEATFFIMATKWEIPPFGRNGIHGVYCVCSYENNKTIIHYIGSSKDIGKRLSSTKHPYRKLYDSGIKVYVKLKQVQDYVLLEKNLIRKIKPPFNKNRYV